MAELLQRTKAALVDCERHLLSTNSRGSEIESYLSQHLVVILCAEMQQEIYLVTESVASSADKKIAQYMQSSCRRLLRSVKKEQIADFIGLLGQDIKNSFNSRLNEREVTIYGNAVNDRHDVAHKHGAQLTLEEIKQAVAAGEQILNAAVNSIAAGT